MWATWDPVAAPPPSAHLRAAAAAARYGLPQGQGAAVDSVCQLLLYGSVRLGSFADPAREQKNRLVRNPPLPNRDRHAPLFHVGAGGERPCTGALLARAEGPAWL